jgi:hypothetical protein
MDLPRYRDFKAFHFEQAIAFKKHLAEQKREQSGAKLSKATLHATLTQLKRFFQWLAWQPGYKSRLQYADAEYFNLSDKDTRIATAKRHQKAPTLEQINHVIKKMPVLAPSSFRWGKKYEGLWRNGYPFSATKSCGAMMPLCSLRPALRWTLIASLQL